MKRIATFTLLIMVLFSACKSVDKYVRKGDYDEAIDYAIKKLEDRKTLKTKDVQGLEYAFNRIKAKEEKYIYEMAHSAQSEWAAIDAYIRRIDRLQRRLYPFIPVVSKDGFKADLDFMNVGRLQEKVFFLANQRDLTEINGIRKSTPEAYLHIYDLYERIDKRQKYVLSHAPIIGVDGYKAEFKLADIAASMSAVKGKAIDELYDVAYANLMSGRKGNKQDARLAVNQFARLLDIDRTHPHAEDLLQEARDIGIVHVIVKLNNKSNVIIPSALEDYIVDTDLDELNGEWIRFYTDGSEKRDFDVIAEVDLLSIQISPEREVIDRKMFYEDVKDGWEYILDEHGNVQKDTLGNDMKRDKYVQVSGEWISIHRSKISDITGAVAYRNRNTGEVRKGRPLNIHYEFNDVSYDFRGDDRVLSSKQKRDLRKRPLPWPSDLDMTMSSGEILRGELINELHRLDEIFVALY